MNLASLIRFKHTAGSVGTQAAAAEPLRRTRRVSLPLFLALAALAGCDKSHKDDHTPASGAQHDDHDEGDGHDHGSAEADEHVDEVTLTSDAVARYGITTASAQLWVLRPTITVPARVGFNTEAMAHVGSPLRGRIAQVNVRLGDAVTKGQELAVIESPELGEAQAEFLQRRVAVETAGPAVDLSRVAWERARGLYEKSQGISLTEVQRREAEHKVSLAALTAAQSARTASANRLQLLGMSTEAIDVLASSGNVDPRYAIRAAIDGVVVQREVTLGELVGPDREYLMVLADATKFWVLADVPEAKLLRIHAGAKAWISVGIVGEARASKLEGSVAFITPFVDPTTRTAQVRIEVSAQDIGLRPGMFAQTEIVESDPDQATPAPVIAVPEEALQSVEGGPALFVPVEGEPNTFAKRSVTIGRAVGGLVPVLTGLVEGETFVNAGTFILKADLGKGAAAHEH